MATAADKSRPALTTLGAKLALCAASGAALGLAFPAATAHWLAWVALAPLFYLIHQPEFRQAVSCALVFGLSYMLVLASWAGLFGGLAWLALAASVSLVFFATFAVAARLLGSRCSGVGKMLLSTCLWVTFEWLSSLWIIGFPWWSVGTSQYRSLALIQISSIAGMWGVSLVLALSNAAAAAVLEARLARRAWRTCAAPIALAAAVAVGSYGYGLTVLGSQERVGQRLRVAVVQGNVRQNVEHDEAYRERVWSAYLDGTRQAAGRGAKLVVWPEGTVPGCAGCDPVLAETLADASAKNEVRLIVGGRDEDDAGQVYNSAFLIGPHGIIDRYRKVRLVPFAEVVPFREHMPYLRKYRILPYDISSGSSLRPLIDGDIKFGALICFESIFPQVSRGLVRGGAQLLCLLTNDTWFERTSGAEQHLAKSVFRAVENRRYVVRAASTGISCLIDPYGRVSKRTGLFEQGLIVGDVELRTDRTLYTRFGDWLPVACGILACGIGVTSRLRAR